MPAPPTRVSQDGPDLVDLLADKLLRAGRGDEGAFADVYDDTAPRVFGLALRVTGDPHLAEQVARGAFADIWREAGRFDRTQGSALAWMLSLAHRRAVECVRSTRAATGRDESTASESGSILGALTATQRRAVGLAYHDGHTHAEVSTLMREPADDTLVQMGSALRSLCRQS